MLPIEDLVKFSPGLLTDHTVNRKRTTQLTQLKRPHTLVGRRAEIPVDHQSPVEGNTEPLLQRVDGSPVS